MGECAHIRYHGDRYHCCLVLLSIIPGLPEDLSGRPRNVPRRAMADLARVRPCLEQDSQGYHQSVPRFLGASSAVSPQHYLWNSASDTAQLLSWLGLSWFTY